jgi:hypothetical protein
MARLDSASRLGWPRRIHGLDDVAENRLAEAPSRSSPLRSRYSQAIWNESSRSWESATVMSKKPTRTVRVPLSSPLRRSLSYFDRNRLGPKDDIAEHVGLRRVQGIADREARIPPIASACDLPSLPPRSPLRLPHLSLGVLHRQAEHVDKPQPLQKRIPALC